MQRLPIAAMAAALPVSTFAHPGHDHAHWSSAAAHGLLFFGVLSVAAMALWIIARRRRRAVQPIREHSTD
jgi:threonine/homoserine/homoserine lactone efflux protein